jgi:aquaporin Z
MATSKTGSSKKPAAKKTSSRVKATATKTTVVAAEAPKKTIFKKVSGEPNYPAIIIAEVIGTMLLTLVALLTLQQLAPLYVGITLAVIVLGIGAASGAHVNPAVTFGLWSARKLKTILLPVYWIAQFVGAILAILLLAAFSNGNGYGLSFEHFGDLNWGVLGAEIVGTAVFLFGIVAVISNEKLSGYAKAFGVGLSLTIGILVSNAVFTNLQSNIDTSKVNISDASTIPREYLIKGATLNPAIALASTENTPSQLSGYGATGDETHYSRLGWEVILGTLIGAALGANLYLLLAYVNRSSK